jgi:hypothetical protein
MITIYSNKYIDKTKKSLLTFSLATIFVISSISFLVQINSIENADAISINDDFSLGLNLVEDSSLGLNLVEDDSSLGLNLVEDDSSLGLNLVEGGGVGGIIVPQNVAPGPPTFNPMFSKCDQEKDHPKETGLLYRWETSKNAITAKLGDKDKLKSKDFSFDIFADLVKDDASFDSKDYPYKADFKTKQDGDTSVNIKEFVTVCSDIVDLQFARGTQIELDKSEALKELGFDS